MAMCSDAKANWTPRPCALFSILQGRHDLARDLNPAGDGSVYGSDVAGRAFHPHGFAGEEQGVGHWLAEHVSGIPVRLVRERGVAAAAVAIRVPRAPFGTHEQITDALVAE